MQPAAPPKLIIGLGNADKKYANTYHNVGHIFIDTANEKLKAFKNDSFMNISGDFVKKVVAESGVKSEELLIVHDDSDLELGTYKFSFGSGAAGHHGVENVARALQTNNFWRLRIGIRKPPAGFWSRVLRIRPKAGSFVLRPISDNDRKILQSVFQKSSEELAAVIL